MVLPKIPAPKKRPSSRPPSAASSTWLRKRIMETRQNNPQIKSNLDQAPGQISIFQRAYRTARKSLYRESIREHVIDVRTKLLGYKSLGEQYNSPFRRRAAIFFSSSDVQQRMVGFKRDIKERVMAIGDSDPKSRVASHLFVIDLMHRDSSFVKRLMPFSLFSFRDPSPSVPETVLASLIDLYRESSEPVRLEVRKAAGPASKLLSNNDPKVVRAAIRFMSYLNYANAFSKVGKLLNHSELSNRSNAHIRRLGITPSQEQASERALRENSIRRNAARYLADFAKSAAASDALKDPPLVRTIYTGLTDSDPVIRQCSARILSLHSQSLLLIGNLKQLSGTMSRYFASETDPETRAHLTKIKANLSS